MELVKTWLTRAGANKPLEKEEIVVEQVPDAQTGLPLLIRASRKR